MKYVVLIFACFLFTNGFAQNKSQIKKVDKEAILKLSKASDKFTLIYTFSVRCGVSLKNLDIAVSFAEKHNLDMNILIVENTGSEEEAIAIKYAQSKFKKANILLISDDYSKRINKKYKLFLKEITPKSFKNYNGLAKYILINNSGEVVMVTNFKDGEKYQWDDDTEFLNDFVLPHIK